MNIYSVKVDSNKYQWLMPQVDEKELLDYLTFDCSQKLKTWQENEWYSFNPNSTEGNFYSIGSGGAFVFDKLVYDSDLFTFLEMSGEIISIRFKGKELFIINVLESVNALDEKSTKWDIYNDGSRGRILDYSFFRDRISESTIFKIPQTCRSEILTYSGVKDEDDEFIKMYHNLGFTGLIFELVWQSH